MTSFSNSHSTSSGALPAKHSSLHATEYMKNIEQTADEEIDGARKVREARRRSAATNYDQIASARKGEETSSSESSTPKSKKPKLKAPQGKSGSSHWDSGENGPSIVMILGEVLSLVAQSSSLNWSMQRTQALSSMHNAFSLAKVTGDATIAAAQAKSDQTSTQADQYKNDAFIAFGIAGASILGGCITEIPKINSESAATDPLAGSFEGRPSVKPVEPAVPAQNVRPVVNPEMKVEGDTAAGRILKDKQSTVMKGLVNFARVSKTVTDQHQFFNAVGTGGQHFMDSGYQSTIAAKQLTEGQQDALAQESQQYSQYHNNVFSLATSSEQTAQQMVDKAAQTLESMSGTITQVVMGMYRG